jgi:hypothetical protein
MVYKEAHKMAEQAVEKSPREEAQYQFDITRKSLIEQHSSLVDDAVERGSCSEHMAGGLKGAFKQILEYMIQFKVDLVLMDKKQTK